MAVDRLGSSFPAVIGIFNTTGTFTTPTGVNKVYVTMRGASGGNFQSTNVTRTGGAAITSGAFVAVTPGSTFAVAIGAAGNNGANAQIATYNAGSRYNPSNPATYNATVTANNGGATSFDTNTFTVNGGNRATNTTGGSAGTASFATGLPTLFPSKAQDRVTSTTTSSTTTTSVSGQVYLFSIPTL